MRQHTSLLLRMLTYADACARAAAALPKRRHTPELKLPQEQCETHTHTHTHTCSFRGNLRRAELELLLCCRSVRLLLLCGCGIAV